VVLALVELAGRVTAGELGVLVGCDEVVVEPPFRAVVVGLVVGLGAGLVVGLGVGLEAGPVLVEGPVDARPPAELAALKTFSAVWAPAQPGVGVTPTTGASWGASGMPNNVVGMALAMAV
jgi:hypothetical protein